MLTSLLWTQLQILSNLLLHFHLNDVLQDLLDLAKSLLHCHVNRVLPYFLGLSSCTVFGGAMRNWVERVPLACLHHDQSLAQLCVCYIFRCYRVKASDRNRAAFSNARILPRWHRRRIC